MVGQLNDVKSVGSGGTGTLIKTGNAVVKAIYVTKSNSGDTMYLLDSTTNAGVTQFQVESDSGVSIPLVNRTFTNGIFVTFSGTAARYIVVFE